MSQNIPLNFRLSPLPMQPMTPQQFADAMVARLTAESTNTISFFASGSVAPTSNVGPWLKNDSTWYVWSNALGQYIPQTLDSSGLRYVAQQAPGPDQTKYTFWIQLDGTGKAQSIQYYSGGAWKDVYQDAFANVPTTAAMTSAIAAAVGGITPAGVVTYPAAATITNQTISANAIDVLMTTAKYIDPNNCFDNASSAYTAPVAGYYRVSAFAQVDNGTATASSMEMAIEINKNGIYLISNGTSVSNPPGLRWYPTVNGLVTLNAGDIVTAVMAADDGIHTGNVVVSNFVFGIELVQKI